MRATRGRSLELDRCFRETGRIKRVSGTDDPTLHKLIDAMLVTLHRGGRIDILEAIQRGHLTPLEVWSRYRLSELDRLPTVETMRPLQLEMETWVEKADTGHWNRASRKYGVRAILRLAKKDATVQDLPDLLRAYASTARGATMFNRTRAALQAFLRETLGKSHPLYARIRDVSVKRVRTREGNPQSPEQLAALTPKLSAAHAEVLWGMATTGMLPHELWGVWKQHEYYTHISGTKRQGRKRDIPVVRPISRPAGTYKSFLLALRNASGGTVLPKDLRNTYSVAMKKAGIERIRRRIYMGHGKMDVTDIYEWETAQGYLKSDGEKLRAFFGTNLPAAHLRLA